MKPDERFFTVYEFLSTYYNDFFHLYESLRNFIETPHKNKTLLISRPIFKHIHPHNCGR